jgi:hypothetical protein
MAIICGNKVTRGICGATGKRLNGERRMYGKNLCNLPLCPGLLRQEYHGWCGVYSMSNDMATQQ